MSQDETAISGVCVRIFPPQNSIMGPKDITLDCGCLLLCGNYDCDTDIFSAINDAGLIYDGGIVVNEVYITCFYHLISLISVSKLLIKTSMLWETTQNFLDDSPTRFHTVGMLVIFGRYYDKIFRCNARELGRYVAQNIIRSCLDSSNSRSFVGNIFYGVKGDAGGLEMSISRGVCELPIFHAPRSFSAYLPGNMMLLCSSLPQNIPYKNSGYLVTGPNVDFGNRLSAVKVNL